MAGKREAAGGEQGWRSYVLPMALCFVVGLLDLGAVYWINVPPEARSLIQPLRLVPAAAPVHEEFSRGTEAAPAATAAPRDAAGTRSPPEPRLTRDSEEQLARLGGFLAVQGQAILAFTLAAAVLFVALASIRLFVSCRRTRRIVLCTLGAQVAVALALLSSGKSVMGAIAGQMRCDAGRVRMVWDFCRRAWEQPQSFAFWAALSCTIVGAVAIFATFVVAATRSERPLPPLLGSQERCVTILIVAASALLTGRMLFYRAFLEWAFADLRALERPSPALQNYLAGTATFNGALETSLLGVTWFIAVVLLQWRQRAPGGAVPSGVTSGREFSLYNLSAISAPMLTALASNAIGG